MLHIMYPPSGLDPSSSQGGVAACAEALAAIKESPPVLTNPEAASTETVEAAVIGNLYQRNTFKDMSDQDGGDRRVQR